MNDLDAILRADRMDSFKLTAKEIKEIIRSAKQCGVSKLTLGPLVVEFQNWPTVEKQINETAPPAEKQIPVITEADIERQKKENAEALKKASAIQRDAELDQMAIMEPERYEELLLQGDLKHDGLASPDPDDDRGVEPAL